MATFFEDWESHTIGAQPAGWTKYGPNQTDNLFTVEDIGGDDGKVLRFANTDGVNAGVELLWTDPAGPGSVADAEVLIRTRATSTSTQEIDHGIAARSALSATDRYQADLRVLTNNNENHRVARHISGSFAQMATTPTTGWDPIGVDPSAWVWIRFRLIGTTLQSRWWLDGTAEPSTWQNETVDTSRASGHVGLTKYAQRGWQVSQFSVGTDGDTAPMAAPSGTTTTLTPNADGSSAGFENEVGATTGLFESVNDPLATPDDANYIVNAGNANASVFLDLTPTESDFGSMDTLSIDVRVNRE